MKKKLKTISFIMPCFNDGNSIERAIRSIHDQDLSNIEIIVIDDGSTDNSKIVLEGLKEQGLINKLILFEKNQGACMARNTGAKKAEGKYFSFLPADAILYPGMARIWYETLEENPEYDFLYGGYRLVDEEGDAIVGQEFFFQPFEPFLLEVTNYIDGSFPIRKESYWKFAKLMNQPDGLWDPNIKSLQDWDFWLSVVKNGGKGIYVRDICFGTTPPHKGGLSDDSSQNWLERTEAIKKKHNIFIRKLCAASLGAGFHAKRIAYLLNADFKEIPSVKPHRYDALYVIGFYPDFVQAQDAMFLNNYFDPSQGRTAAKKVVHFVGSDVWQLKTKCSYEGIQKVWKPYFTNYIDEILCEAPFIQKELEDLGIKSKIVPIPPLKIFEIKPLPEEFIVACYWPQVNHEFYRPAEMIEIAKRMPDIKFKFFGHPQKIGIDPALPSNVQFMGYITDMEKFIESCSAVMRFPIHDGLPINVMEFLLMGRYSVQGVPMPHTSYLPEFSIDAAIRAIRDIQELAKKGVNQIASDYWRVVCNHDKYKQTILEICGYNPKEYWENRAKAWTEQAAQMNIETEEIKPLFEKAKKLLEKENPTIHEVGCGDGRWYPILKKWGFEYSGSDISENLIKAAQFRFPAIKDEFYTIKVEDISNRKGFDIIFSYTCLEHVKEEDFQKAVDAMKRIGKYFIIVEPINFTSRYYCHSHNYEKAFNVIEKIQLKDKVAYLCSN